jgi:hypothetical protein
MDVRGSRDDLGSMANVSEGIVGRPI